jgi:hypothetical protein
MAAAITNALSSASELSRMGSLASEFVAQNFEQAEQIRQLEGYYNEAIKSAVPAEPVHQGFAAPVPAHFPQQVAVD